MFQDTQGSLHKVGKIAAAVFVVAFLALLLLSGYSFFGAVFLAAVVAAVVAILLYFGFVGGSDGPSMEASESKPMPAAAPVAEPAPVAKAAPTPEPAPELENSATPEPVPEPAPAPAPEPAPVVAPQAGAKPAGLDGPRGGTADDLKRIKGIGPKLEKLLNSMGFWHFDQIGNWAASDVAWVDQNLEGFKGRVTRDNWVSQAQTLAAGGET